MHSADVPACALLCDSCALSHFLSFMSSPGTLLQSAACLHGSLLTGRQLLPVQAAKAALKAAAGALAEAVAERDAAGDERGSIETQLAAALKSVAGGLPNAHQVMTERQQSCSEGLARRIVADEVKRCPCHVAQISLGCGKPYHLMLSCMRPPLPNQKFC